VTKEKAITKALRNRFETAIAPATYGIADREVASLPEGWGIAWGVIN
jgi:hypothetical protein